MLAGSTLNPTHDGHNVLKNSMLGDRTTNSASEHNLAKASKIATRGKFTISQTRRN